MPIYTRKSLLTVAPEGTYGTAASSGYVPLEVIRDPDVAPLVANRAARETVRPWWGADRKKLIDKQVTLNFDVYLAGSGAAGTAPAYGELLRACGFGETIVAATSATYALAADGSALIGTTLRWYADGILHQVRGARGTVSFNLTTQEYPRLNFAMTGIYTQPTETAIPSTTYSSFTNQAAPLEVGATQTPTVSINSVSRCMSEFELSIANEVNYENYAGCTERIAISGREPEGRIQVESTMLTGAGNQNVYALATGTTLVPITWTHGTVAGSIAALTMSNCDIYEPSLQTRNNVQFLDIPFAPLSIDGTSEMTLVLT